MTMRSFLYVLLMLMNADNSWSLFRGHGLSVSRARLDRMGQAAVDRAFKQDHALAVRSYAQSNVLNHFRFELALDRCAAYLNWLSRSEGGPQGSAFIRQCKNDLRQQITEAPRT